MIKYKKKICLGCGKDVYIFSHSLCNNCYRKKKAEEYRKKAKPNKPKIKQTSEKQKEKNAEYKKARLEFLLEKDHCEVATDGCLVPYPIVNPTEMLTVHHKTGRIGSLLTDKKYFLAVCMNCHRVIEDNPKWAYDNGYSIPRLNIKN